MGEPDGRWLPSSHVDIYHGRASGEGGSVWVYARVHSWAGLHVEVHHHDPNGQLLRRTAVSHAGEAAELVERLRTAMVRRGVEAVKGGIEPLVTRGRLVVHGWHGRNASDAMILDDSMATLLCAQIWVTVGVHHIEVAMVSTMSTKPLAGRVRRGSPAKADVTVEGASTTELWMSRVRHQVRSGHPRLHRLCGLPTSSRSVAD